MVDKLAATLCVLLSLAPLSGRTVELEAALDIGSRLELFVDRYLIESLEGLSLELHSPQPAL